ncbi:PREDICTED: BTB/POZ domain-containing protein At5g48130-like [Camelina sativa]|uniref:BTB/POZ domain-containing protein At5g48130-like n=1 Tax=Camelina sativa TaxID=90675 RepID=A0ABM0UT69_CAMSA|nr:PREDICTED: BTB/POZ domain-containing protein At5g48130-like [Camelina sativa]
METYSFKDGSSVASSPISSPNISTLLKIKVLSWSKETGLPASVHVRVCNKTFNLHKTLLCTKSGYFKEREDQLSEIEIPQDFPGGAETFEKIMLFIYGCPTLIHPFNIAGLRCAAQFLQMTEHYSTSNLCERFDLYLNQVVLQNWDDTLVVLKTCQELLPWSEDLLIVSRCIESLAFTACMEILDPERRREKPMVMLEDLMNQPWEYTTVEKIINQDTWIKDLTDLPFAFFRQVTGSLRRQGMKERYVSPLIVFYVNKCFIPEDQTNTDILQRALDLLLTRDKAYRFIPVGFYFACLARNLKHETLVKLQYQIVSLLHTAHTENFIYPKAWSGNVAFSQELLTMENLFVAYVSTESERHLTSSPSNVMRVGNLWDIYLSSLPYDQDMETKRFIELIETVPMLFRESHDQLYLAVNAFLQVHKAISQEEKGSICSYLNCQKLSEETSLELVQNEQMPLRLVVQALFVQQLNTHQAFKDCSDSFRFTNSADFSGSVVPTSRPLTSQHSPCTDDETGPRNRPLCFLMQKDATLDEYESTSFRIHNLEEQLVSLKKTLQSQSNPKKPTCLGKRSASRNRSTFGQVTTACIGSVSFTSQRKYANRLLRVLRRVNLFGSRKTNKSER